MSKSVSITAKKSTFAIVGCVDTTIKSKTHEAKLRRVLFRHVPHIRNMLILLRRFLREEPHKDNPVLPVLMHKEQCRDWVYGRLTQPVLASDADDKKRVAHYKSLSKWQARVDATVYMQTLPEDDKARQMWQQLVSYVQTHLDAKTTFKIIKKLHAEFEQYFTNIADYQANTIAYAKKFGNSGMPKPPKTKKLKNIVASGLTLDTEKWRFETRKHKNTVTGIESTRRYLSMTVEKTRWRIPFDESKLPLPKGMCWRSLNISCYHGKVSFNFTYGHNKSVSEPISADAIDEKATKPVVAAIDLGLNVLGALVVDDDTTPSLLFCGMKLKAYSHNFNAKKAQIDKQIGQCAVDFNTIERDKHDKQGNKVIDENGQPVKEAQDIPIAYNQRGKKLLSVRKRMWIKREQVMESHFRQVSSRIMDVLRLSGVTDLVLSKNLNFLKTQDDKRDIGHKFNKRFYSLPLGRLIAIVERKCELVGVKVHFIDEAYTSKTSSLSSNVIDIQSRAQQARLQSQPHNLTSADYGGSRSKRGRFVDSVLGLHIHADINGAINHMKVGVGIAQLPLDVWLKRKHKLCEPIRLRSDQQAVRLIHGLAKRAHSRCDSEGVLAGGLVTKTAA